MYNLGFLSLPKAGLDYFILNFSLYLLEKGLPTNLYKSKTSIMRIWLTKNTSEYSC